METMIDGLSTNLQSLDYFSLHEGLCGPIAATMNEKMYSLVISKWRNCFEGLKITNEYKFLSAAGSLLKCMIRMLDLVLKLLPEDSNECQTARVLLYKLFYDQTEEGLTQFLLKLFKCFDPHKQPKSDLADLLEIIHAMLQLMEKLQAHGSLRVSKKARGRRRITKEKGQNNVESEQVRETSTTHDDTKPPYQMCEELGKSTKESLPQSCYAEREQGVDQDGSSIFGSAFVTDMPQQNTVQIGDQSPAIDDKVHEKPVDEEYGMSNSSNDDQPANNEVNFNISALVSIFASNIVIHNLCWLLKHYKANSVSTNHYVICMLMRFCEDLELSPMLYQLSLLTTFYDILEEQKTFKSKEHTNIVKFLTEFIRKMFKIMKKQPLLFVEILFWKTRRECQLINAEALMGSIVNLRKDVRNMDQGMVGSSKYDVGMGCRSIADALGEDEIDLDVPLINHGLRMEPDAVGEDNVLRTNHSEFQKNSVSNILENEIDKDTREAISAGLQDQRTGKSHKGCNFTEEQETIVIELYEKYKNERQCSRLIAEALDPNGQITSVIVSRKLRQLGLKVIPKKKLIKSEMTSKATGDSVASGSAACEIKDAMQLGLNELGENHSLRTSMQYMKKLWSHQVTFDSFHT
ncbi:hypothetical protein AXF42_Ash009467 [Apostasia shenzhenica]|uniref:Uncharacterized protein n=1 Tax=Apostasia shenzhenica TaxID=1088818 RepID=A0A2I0B8X5_9ASPA|nr:hypothetical protein AXF42_Ash009467 [Apostasia shenzhenica]